MEVKNLMFIENKIFINYETMQLRLDACRSMFDAGCHEKSQTMLIEMAKDILKEGKLKAS